jgi:hypothetical protein
MKNKFRTKNEGSKLSFKVILGLTCPCSFDQLLQTGIANRKVRHDQKHTTLQEYDAFGIL